MDTFPSPEDIYSRNEYFEKFIESKKNLKERDKKFLRLVWYEGYKCNEIAFKFSLCDSRIYQIRNRIFRIIGKEENG